MPLMPGAADADEVDALDLVLHARAAEARDARRRRRARRRRLAVRVRGVAPSRARAARSSAGSSSARRSRRQRRLRLTSMRAPRVDEELRVGALLVGDRAGQRDEERAQAHRGELGDGDRAAAADHEVGPRVARRHVVDERDALGRRRRRRAYASRSASMCFSPAWWTIGGRASRGSRASAAGTQLVQRLRAEAAADDEQAQRPVAPGEALRRAAATRTIASRTGLPTHSTTLRVPCRASASGKPSRMRSAPCASTRFASPATAFASCSTSGLPPARRPSARRGTTRSRRSRARRRACGGE